MSDSKQLDLPAPEQASQVMDLIYAQRFFDKLAELRVFPQTDAEKMAALETAARLDSLPEPEPTPADNFFLAANAKLANVMHQQPSQAAHRTKTAEQAYSLATDPTLYSAALSLCLANTAE